MDSSKQFLIYEDEVVVVVLIVCETLVPTILQALRACKGPGIWIRERSAFSVHCYSTHRPESGPGVPFSATTWFAVRPDFKVQGAVLGRYTMSPRSLCGRVFFHLCQGLRHHPRVPDTRGKGGMLCLLQITCPLHDSPHELLQLNVMVGVSLMILDDCYFYYLFNISKSWV